MNLSTRPGVYVYPNRRYNPLPIEEVGKVAMPRYQPPAPAQMPHNMPSQLHGPAREYQFYQAHVEGRTFFTDRAKGSTLNFLA